MTTVANKDGILTITQETKEFVRTDNKGYH